MKISKIWDFQWKCRTAVSSLIWCWNWAGKQTFCLCRRTLKSDFDVKCGARVDLGLVLICSAFLLYKHGWISSQHLFLTHDLSLMKSFTDPGPQRPTTNKENTLSTFEWFIFKNRSAISEKKKKSNVCWGFSLCLVLCNKVQSLLKRSHKRLFHGDWSVQMNSLFSSCVFGVNVGLLWCHVRNYSKRHVLEDYCSTHHVKRMQHTQCSRRLQHICYTSTSVKK